MKEQVLAKRYARALIVLGQNEKILDALQSNLQKFADILREMPQVYQLLTMIEIRREKRHEVIDSVADKIDLHVYVKNMLHLLLNKNRIGIFFAVVDQFVVQKNLIENRTVAQVKAANLALVQKHTEQLQRALESMLKKQVVLHYEKDESLIGGLQVQVGDTIYDGSIKGELRKVRALSL